VLIDAEISSDAILIRIGDDGPGLDPKAANRPIEPSQRLDQSETGAGLGLVISGDIVDSLAVSLNSALQCWEGLRRGFQFLWRHHPARIPSLKQNKIISLARNFPYEIVPARSR